MRSVSNLAVISYYPIHARPVHKINEFLRVAICPQGNFLCGGLSCDSLGGKICRKAIAVAKSSLISIVPHKGIKTRITACC
jgi:hypothetical protein